MKLFIMVGSVIILFSMAQAFDFAQVQVNYDAKGKAENIILEYEQISAVIFDIPQTKKTVKPEEVMIFTMGTGAPKKKAETLSGTPVIWLSCNVDWTLDKPPSVTATFPKDTTLDFSKTYKCYFLTEGKWEETINAPRVDAKNRSISIWMKHLGTYAVSYK